MVATLQFFDVPKVLIEPAHTNSVHALNLISMHTVCILCASNVIGVHVVCIVCAACFHQVSTLPFEQRYMDPMHDNEHGNILTVKCCVIKLQNFGEEHNLSPGVFVKRLKTRFLGAPT